MTTGWNNGEGRLVSLVGGSGFIGSALARLLSRNRYRVRIVDIAPSPLAGRGVDYRRCDINDLEGLTACLSGSDAVVNLAAEHRDDVQPVSLYQRVNVDGARTLCAAASRLGVGTIVFTSSVAVYGAQTRGADESTPPAPNHPYGVSKLLAEAVYKDWLHEQPQDRCLLIVRPTVVFGPGNRGNVYNIFRYASGPLFFMVGRGDNRKSMAFVENVAAYLLFCLERRQAGLFLSNYCDGPDFTMAELLAKVRTCLGRSPRPLATAPYELALLAGAALDGVAALTRRKGFAISRLRIEKFSTETVFSADRARSAGFIPPHDLLDAIEATIRHEFGG